MVLVETDVEKAEERAELAESKANELEEELKVDLRGICVIFSNRLFSSRPSRTPSNPSKPPPRNTRPRKRSTLRK